MIHGVQTIDLYFITAKRTKLPSKYLAGGRNNIAFPNSTVPKTIRQFCRTAIVDLWRKVRDAQLSATKVSTFPTQDICSSPIHLGLCSIECGEAAQLFARLTEPAELGFSDIGKDRTQAGNAFRSRTMLWTSWLPLTSGQPGKLPSRSQKRPRPTSSPYLLRTLCYNLKHNINGS